MQLTTFVAAATIAMSAAHAATTYEGNGQVPQQFVQDGKIVLRNLYRSDGRKAEAHVLDRKSVV